MPGACQPKGDSGVPRNMAQQINRPVDQSSEQKHSSRSARSRTTEYSGFSSYTGPSPFATIRPSESVFSHTQAQSEAMQPTGSIHIDLERTRRAPAPPSVEVEMGIDTVHSQMDPKEADRSTKENGKSESIERRAPSTRERAVGAESVDSTKPPEHKQVKAFHYRSIGHLAKLTDEQKQSALEYLVDCFVPAEQDTLIQSLLRRDASKYANGLREETKKEPQRRVGSARRTSLVRHVERQHLLQPETNSSHPMYRQKLLEEAAHLEEKAKIKLAVFKERCRKELIVSMREEFDRTLQQGRQQLNQREMQLQERELQCSFYEAGFQGQLRQIEESKAYILQAQAEIHGVQVEIQNERQRLIASDDLLNHRWPQLLGRETGVAEAEKDLAADTVRMTELKREHEQREDELNAREREIKGQAAKRDRAQEENEKRVAGYEQAAVTLQKEMEKKYLRMARWEWDLTTREDAFAEMQNPSSVDVSLVDSHSHRQSSTSTAPVSFEIPNLQGRTSTGITPTAVSDTPPPLLQPPSATASSALSPPRSSPNGTLHASRRMKRPAPDEWQSEAGLAKPGEMAPLRKRRKTFN